MALLLGIDLGTSYFKAALFDLQGRLKGLGRVAVDRANPAPGRYELATEVFWRLLKQAVQEAMQQAGAEAKAIGGMSYSSQASTFLLLDERDEPLTPLISWLDTRGEGLEPALAAFSKTEQFHERVGFSGVGSQSAVSKWRWFQRERPGVWARTRSVMTISDYFTFALTGERAGDAGTAAFVGLYDLQRREWWPAALAAFEIEREKLSTLLPPGATCGRTCSRAAELLGLPAGIPFAVGSLDHHAGAIGAGVGRLAEVSITTGTVLAALALVTRVTTRRDCFHGPHIDGKSYYCLAFDPGGAGRLEDYQRQFAPELTIERLLALAETAGDNDDASGGAGRLHGSAVRRILEEIALTHRRLVQAVSEPGGSGNVLATGGGARSRLWLQIKADVLRRPVVTSRSPEQGCLGAAVFASVAGGHHANFEEAQTAMTVAGETFRPKAR